MRLAVNGETGLLRHRKLVKLRREIMNTIELQSEGVALDATLAELERERATREISGWETGFTNLSRALDGIRPGLYLIIGAPGIGKTCFARQLVDQVAMQNRLPGIFFSFAENKKELRIRTFARLSGLEQREIRRGSAYLLHWYGVPRLASSDSNELPPSWEKLKRVAEEAKTWLDSIYLVECGPNFTASEMEAQIAALRAQIQSEQMMIVVDDCQRLGRIEHSLDMRLQTITEQLQQTARRFRIPLLAVWPALESDSTAPAQQWAERVAGPDIIFVLEKDRARSDKINALSQAVILHVVKNRDGEKGRLAYDFTPAFARFTEA
jgi:replicative DNA helicase